MKPAILHIKNVRVKDDIVYTFNVMCDVPFLEFEEILNKNGKGKMLGKHEWKPIRITNNLEFIQGIKHELRFRGVLNVPEIIIKFTEEEKTYKFETCNFYVDEYEEYYIIMHFHHCKLI